MSLPSVPIYQHSKNTATTRRKTLRQQREYTADWTNESSPGQGVGGIRILRICHGSVCPRTTDPLGPVHLAPLSKISQRVLMFESSISAWKSARRSVATYPEPFHGVSEPVSTNLVFLPVHQNTGAYSYKSYMHGLHATTLVGKSHAETGLERDYEEKCQVSLVYRNEREWSTVFPHRHDGVLAGGDLLPRGHVASLPQLGA
ncbi:hypothetical protein EV421DRAFT_1743642 [Armillaria borealis]|uniref:Uncharacterized protein n=1 Tax=Armillaria borealis TaxID=47425 RepID=A0AA39MDH8_9AGAR|nr:hypothetical protein EV421DRAFT_1743642 [Armillaria borealis]